MKASNIAPKDSSPSPRPHRGEGRGEGFLRCCAATAAVALIAIPLCLAGVLFYLWARLPDLPRKEDGL